MSRPRSCWRRWAWSRSPTSWAGPPSTCRSGPAQREGLAQRDLRNAAELIIAVIALTKGLNEIVKASLTGSILGNLLLVAGAAMVVGGWNREKQTFSRAKRRVQLGSPAAVGRGDAVPRDLPPQL